MRLFKKSLFCHFKQVCLGCGTVEKPHFVDYKYIMISGLLISPNRFGTE